MVANTTTVIHGEQEASPIDTFLSDAHTAELAHWIAATGKRLSTIYITRAHPDHFFGLKLLRDRFPQARAVVLPRMVESMHRALANDAGEGWRRRFPGQIPDRLVAAENAIVALDIGHTDTDHTTCLHVPSLGLVVAGYAPRPCGIRWKEPCRLARRRRQNRNTKSAGCRRRTWPP
jgi:glyoxylase-like metal-dependent hydrolase (beta-lactamase superfamily II)